MPVWVTTPTILTFNLGSALHDGLRVVLLQQLLPPQSRGFTNAASFLSLMVPLSPFKRRFFAFLKNLNLWIERGEYKREAYTMAGTKTLRGFAHNE